MPPKPDAFADLFAPRKASDKMLMQQRMQQGLGATPSPRNSPVPTTNGARPGLSDPFDVFGGSLGASKPSGTASNSTADLLDDFFGPGSFGGQKPGQNTGSGAAPATQPRTATPLGYPADPSPGPSLLDDDFMDAFTPEPPLAPRSSQASPAPGQMTKEELRRAARLSLLVLASREPSRPTSEASRPISRSQSADPARDAVVAQLVDIGFDVAAANDAIDRKGCDVQACVNYIMAKAAGKEDSGDSRRPASGRLSRQSRPQNPSQPSDDDILRRDTPDWLNKGVSMGVSLWSKANQTIKKNIDQFVEGPARDDGLPAWMQLAQKYKLEALEKKYGGEDYGLDLENIDQEEIQRIMREEREKRERRRYEGKESPRDTPRDSPRVLGERPRSGRALAEPRSGRVLAEPRGSGRALAEPRAPVKPSRAEPEEYALPQRPLRRQRPSESASESSRPASRTAVSALSQERASPAPPKPVSAPTAEFDLLGINSAPTSLLRSTAPLNQFEEVDYSTVKDTASEAYRTGDYSTALELYQRCLERLPESHELRVVIALNLGVVYKHVGQLKDSLAAIEAGMALVDPEEVNGPAQIGGKPAKYWYTKMVLTKAEVYELLEKYSELLEMYTVLVTKLGVSDRKVTDGKRRVDKVVNPQNYRPKPAKKSAPAAPKAAPKPKQAAPKLTEPSSEQLDAIEQEVIAWATRKQNNLRGMLTNLDEIIPAKITMKPQLRKLALNDLMLPKQVKLSYMKVISAIHPDKLASQCPTDSREWLLCNSVFIRLNKAWEQFKVDENVA